jgi:hypothetical protein
MPPIASASPERSLGCPPGKFRSGFRTGKHCCESQDRKQDADESSRAKLKRLTNDDRERVLRSRQLPADFDTTQALHSPFGAQAPSMSGSMSMTGTYPSYGDNNGVRSLTLDTLRRVPDYDHYGQQQHYVSPTGVSPALGAFTFTPPQSSAEHMSPTSGGSSMSPYVLQQSSAYDPTRRPVTSLPPSHTSYPSQSQLQRVSLQDRLSRTMGETTGSPLRTSVSYANLNSTSAQPRSIPSRAASFSENTYPQRPQPSGIPTSGADESGPYGLGFSCELARLDEGLRIN